MKKYLGEYVDEIFELVESLGAADKCAVIEGAKNMLIHRSPQDFLDWTDSLVNCPPDRRQHPHHDVLVAERREAFDRLVELKSSRQG